MSTTQWETRKASHILDLVVGGTPPTDRPDYYDGEIPWVTIADLTGGNVNAPAKSLTASGLAACGGRLLEPGTLLYSFKLSIGRTAFVERPVATNEAIAAILPSSKIDLGYARWALPRAFDEAASTNIYGAKILNQEQLKAARVLYPPMDVQRQIADYLDHETAEIDAFIADLESLRAGLEEHRLGELADLLPYPKDLFRPDSSSVVPLKHLGSITLGKMLDASVAAEQTRWRYIRAANVQPLGRLVLDDVKTMPFSPAERVSLDIRAGDVLVVEGGQGGFGRATFVAADLPELGFQNSIVRFRPGAKADGRFVTYAMHLLRHSGYIKTVASVTSMPHFTAEKVAVTPVPLMSKERQAQIADALDDRWSEIDEASEDVEAAIALAKERRAALITAAVTGQIDVTAKQIPAVDTIQKDIEEAR